MGRPIPARFYARATSRVARELLGKVVVSRSKGMLTSGRIVETEAYGGTAEEFGGGVTQSYSSRGLRGGAKPGLSPRLLPPRLLDLAAHSCRGVTPRTSVMFGPPGHAYVYFIYGMYEMLNLVTEPAGCPGAVLIRALEPMEGIDAMRVRRPSSRSVRDLCNGPGKLCRALAVPLSWNGKSLLSKELRVLDDGFKFSDAEVLESPRVGISQGNEHYWRFFAKGSPFVSRAPENESARPYRAASRLKKIAGGA